MHSVRPILTKDEKKKKKFGLYSIIHPCTNCSTLHTYTHITATMQPVVTHIQLIGFFIVLNKIIFKEQILSQYVHSDGQSFSSYMGLNYVSSDSLKREHLDQVLIIQIQTSISHRKTRRQTTIMNIVDLQHGYWLYGYYPTRAGKNIQ